jgi:Ca-activated chloride channel homolog
VETPADPWTHDLTTTSHSTDLWPILLILAMLLWPLDIALRRVSIGRRELVAARGWVVGIGGRRRAAGPRTATAESLLGARERAAGSSARAALMTSPTATDEATATERTPATASPTPPPAPTAPPAPKPSAEPEAPATPKPCPEPDSSDTIARLRDAKRRARER